MLSVTFSTGHASKADKHWLKSGLSTWQPIEGKEDYQVDVSIKAMMHMIEDFDEVSLEAIKRTGIKYVYILDNNKEVGGFRLDDTPFNHMRTCRKVWLCFFAEHWHLNETIRMWSRVEHNWYQHEDAPDVEQAIKANFLSNNEA